MWFAEASVSQVREAPRIRVEQALLALFTIAGTVGILKGLPPDLIDGSEYYWVLSYRHGFIKRGFVGTLVRPLLERWSFDQLKPLIMTAHIAACLWIVYACYRLFRWALHGERDVEARITLTMSFLCLMCSQLMPTLAHDAGYVDVYVIALVLGAFSLIVKERYVEAALLTAVGPFVHESFIFVWAPVAIILLWSSAVTKAGVGKKLLAAAMPAVLTAAVIVLHSDRAVRLSIEAAPLSEDTKGLLITHIFEQTIPSAFHHMMVYDFRDDLGNFAIAAAYFLLPAAVLIWAAAFCYGRAWPARRTTFLVVVLATLSPLTILVLAWDLSRFLAWSNLAAFVALIASGSRTLLPPTRRA